MKTELELSRTLAAISKKLADLDQQYAPKGTLSITNTQEYMVKRLKILKEMELIIRLDKLAKTFKTLRIELEEAGAAGVNLLNAEARLDAALAEQSYLNAEIAKLPGFIDMLNE